MGVDGVGEREVGKKTETEESMLRVWLGRDCPSPRDRVGGRKRGEAER